MDPTVDVAQAGCTVLTRAIQDAMPSVAFRPIFPDDAGRLVDTFERLSPTSRYFRFLAPIRSLSDTELHRLSHVDFIDHVAWAAELIEEPGRPFVGVGRWVRSQHDPALAEIAIAIVDAYQRRGLGTALLKLLAQSALPRRVRWFEAHVLDENQPMRALLRGLGARPVRLDSGVYVLHLSVTVIADSVTADAASPDAS